MKLYKRRWLLMAALTMGTALQVSACREEFAFFGLRTAFTSITLPINQLIQQLLLGI